MPTPVPVAVAVVVDASLVRALVVPALMRLLGNANWWLPHWTRRALFIGEERRPEAALEGS
jgi:RND superfamily putative drug exporter